MAKRRVKKSTKKRVNKRVSDVSWDDYPYRKDEEGHPLCRKCGVVLTGRKTAWCSQACVNEIRAMIDWRYIRQLVKRRDHRKCVLCGMPGLEVDHIVELCDGGSFWEMSNLRLLCHPHHLEKTLRMRKERAARKKRVDNVPSLFNHQSD